MAVKIVLLLLACLALIASIAVNIKTQHLLSRSLGIIEFALKVIQEDEAYKQEGTE